MQKKKNIASPSTTQHHDTPNNKKDFRVLRIGTSIRVNKQSFDNWFAAV